MIPVIQSEQFWHKFDLYVLIFKREAWYIMHVVCHRVLQRSTTELK